MLITIAGQYTTYCDLMTRLLILHYTPSLTSQMLIRKPDNCIRKESSDCGSSSRNVAFVSRKHFFHQLLSLTAVATCISHPLHLYLFVYKSLPLQRGRLKKGLNTSSRSVDFYFLGAYAYSL
ncbi:hypothetical protein L6452_36075 [Arctium lappa]|uniref:Uncharacterized protein n=1 Tax=Arctium lappa TaxID=4217 RepID=A0ACB8Y859_ARCLA|nr:hypothetical protein L6452_36075 [Arctium lappa]